MIDQCRELYEREAKERENDVEGMKQEFSTRLGQLERSLAAVVKVTRFLYSYRTINKLLTLTNQNRNETVLNAN